jgi:hypothetical protein
MVTGGDELGAAAQAHPVDGGERRHREALQSTEDPLPLAALLEGVAAVADPLELAHIQPVDEGPRLRAANDDRDQLARGDPRLQLADETVEKRQRRRREEIHAGFRIVQSDPADVVAIDVEGQGISIFSHHMSPR